MIPIPYNNNNNNNKNSNFFFLENKKKKQQLCQVIESSTRLIPVPTANDPRLSPNF